VIHTTSRKGTGSFTATGPLAEETATLLGLRQVQSQGRGVRFLWLPTPTAHVGSRLADLSTRVGAKDNLARRGIAVQRERKVRLCHQRKTRPMLPTGLFSDANTAMNRLATKYQVLRPPRACRRLPQVSQQIFEKQGGPTVGGRI